MREQYGFRRFGFGLFAVFALVCSLLCVGCGLTATPDYEVSDESTSGFGTLLCDLVNASDKPSSDDAQRIDADVKAIRDINAQDGEVAEAIASRWQQVYLDPDFELCLYGGGKLAPELEGSGIEDDTTHAFVVLGYELKDGKMQDELCGRCDAAAAAARTYPNTILVCTGGATGDNNPDKHTEAGLMKEYLCDKCGIDAERIFTDESAMTTAENAENTLKILRDQGVKTMTIVTSSYHQRWGQVVYTSMAALYKQRYNHNVDIVGDYSYNIEPSVELYKQDTRIAVMQVGQILALPYEVMETLPPITE